MTIAVGSIKAYFTDNKMPEVQAVCELDATTQQVWAEQMQIQIITLPRQNKVARVSLMVPPVGACGWVPPLPQWGAPLPQWVPPLPQWGAGAAG